MIVILASYICCGDDDHDGCFCCLLFVKLLKIHGFVILLCTEYNARNLLLNWIICKTFNKWSYFGALTKDVCRFLRSADNSSWFEDIIEFLLSLVVASSRLLV